MKSLGQQVKAFRQAQKPKAWSTQRMADEVGTSRQNIENLEKRGFGQPRYIAALARVMGKPVDELLGVETLPPKGAWTAAEPGSAADDYYPKQVHVFTVSQAEWDHLQDLRDMWDEDRDAVIAKAKEASAHFKSQRRQLLASVGIPNGEANAANVNKIQPAPKTPHKLKGSLAVRVEPDSGMGELTELPEARPQGSRYVATDKVVAAKTAAAKYHQKK